VGESWDVWWGGAASVIRKSASKNLDARLHGLAGWLEDVPPDYSEIRLCLCVTNLVMKDDNWSKGTPAKLSTLSLSLCLSIYFRLIILGTAFDES
jgi:hypothetical protein